MARTDDTQVRAVIELDVAFVTTPFIAAANELVTELCSASNYSDTRLALIETWLAAHFCAIREKRTASESAGSVSESYQFRLGLELQSTMYGQQALLFDTKGALAALSKNMEEGKRATIGITWLGKACSTAISAEDDLCSEC